MTHKLVYFLVHKDTLERVRYYHSLGGARIAQRHRNARLGFHTRIARSSPQDNWEVEQCVDADGQLITATYCIVEDTLDSPDLLYTR